MITEKMLIKVFAEGIGRKEGYYDQKKMPTIPQRLNNPGDLRQWRYSSWVWNPEQRRNVRELVPYETANGYVAFPGCEKLGCVHPDHPSEIGWEALREQCARNIFNRQLTFLEFFNGKRDHRKTLYMGFAPAADKNDPYAYAEFLLAFCKRKLALDESLDMKTVIASVVDTPTLKPAVPAPINHRRRPEYFGKGQKKAA